jgi:hypothetical protein
MRIVCRAAWIAVPAILSLAADCGEQGVTPLAPATITTVTVALSSPAEAAPTDPIVQEAYQNCLTQTPQPAMRPSWRNYNTVALTPAGANRWQASFTDVPVGFVNTFFVLDPNECARTPTGTGQTILGVSATDVALTSAQTPGCRTANCNAGYFVFTVTSSGVVTMPPSGT